MATGGELPVLITTVSAAELTVPSLTINCAMYWPDRSATKVGMTALGLESAALLPAGLVVRDQAYVSGLPSTSEEAEPLRVTVLPTATVWSGPALATGGLLSVVIVIVSAAELTKPSFTMS